MENGNKRNLWNLPSIHPNKIARSLRESIHGNVGRVKVFKSRPPTAVQIIYVVLLTQLLDATPICVGRRKPLAVTWADVDVDGAEVVVLLVARRSTVGHFHVKLNGVHAEDHVADVREHV